MYGYRKADEVIRKEEFSNVSEREHFSKMYGINRCSLQTSLPHFDVTKQLLQDIMHVLEYLFLAIRQHQLLNERITCFPYAYYQTQLQILQDHKQVR